MKNNIFINSLIIGFEKTLQFLIIYFLSTFYSEYEFAIYIEYISLSLVLSIFYGLGASIFLKELFSKYGEDYSDCFFDILKFVLILSLPITLIILLIINFINISIPTEFYVILIIQSVVSSINNIWNVNNILLSLHLKRALYLLLVPLAIFIALVVYNASVYELILVQLFFSFISLFFITPRFKINSNVFFKSSNMIVYLPHSLCMYIILNSDRLMISILSTDNELVKYTLATQFTNLLNLITILFELVFLKYLLIDAMPLKININLIKILSVPFYLFIGFFLVFLFGYVYPNYQSSANEIIIINSLAMSFMFIYMVNVNTKISHGKGRSVVFFSSTFAVINLILNYLFIPSYGALAASLSSLFVYILMAAFTFSNRKDLV